MKKLLEHLRKIVAKTNQTDIRVRKLIKRKGEKIDKKSWIDKKILLLTMSYYPEPRTIIEKNKG